MRLEVEHLDERGCGWATHGGQRSEIEIDARASVSESAGAAPPTGGRQGRRLELYGCGSRYLSGFRLGRGSTMPLTAGVGMGTRGAGSPRGPSATSSSAMARATREREEGGSVTPPSLATKEPGHVHAGCLGELVGTLTALGRLVILGGREAIPGEEQQEPELLANNPNPARRCRCS